MDTMNGVESSLRLLDLQSPLLRIGVEKQQVRKPPRRCIGYLCCAAVVASWIAQSEVCQAVQVGGYNKPMAITWLNHSCGAFVLVLLLPVIGPRRLRSAWAVLAGGRSWRQLFANVFSLSAVYLLADWFWYIGLPYTSVAVGTIIFNTSSVWVYAFSVLCGREPRRWQRTLALLVSLVGVVVVSCAPDRPVAGGATKTDQSESLSFWGAGLVLLAAIGYAAYEVFLDGAFGGACEQDAFAASVLTSLSGLVTAATLWPVLVLLGLPVAHQCFSRIGAWETPELPSAREAHGLLINAVLATIFNVTLVLAVTLSSPLLASVSCMLTIPVSLVVDTIVHGYRFGAWELLGSAFVLGGFVVLVRDDRKQ